MNKRQFRKLAFISVIVLLILVSCKGKGTLYQVTSSPSPPSMKKSQVLQSITPSPTNNASATSTDTAIPTSTLTLSCTPTPTGTPIPIWETDPYGDIDEDGFFNLYEHMWDIGDKNNLVNSPTTFKALKNLPNTVYAHIRVSQPFATSSPGVLDVDELNSTAYQYVNPDTWNVYGDIAEFEVVLFPYISLPTEKMEVSNFPIDPNNYPSHVQPFLENNPQFYSYFTPEMQSTLIEVLNNGNVTTDVDAINKLRYWTNTYLDLIDTNSFSLGSFGKVTSMFNNEQIFNSCSVKSSWMNFVGKAVGIPTRVGFGVYAHEEACNMFANHAQNYVFLDGEWVLLEYNDGLDPFYLGSSRDPFSGGNLIITDFANDISEFDLSRYLAAERGELNGNYLELHKLLDVEINGK